MQKETERRSDIFSIDEPFGNFHDFGMRSSLFGGRDPFDDPFFTRPFGSLFKSPSIVTTNTSQSSGAKGIVIEELDSDDEKEEENHTNTAFGKEPSVEHPDEDRDVMADLAEEKSKNVKRRNYYNRIEGTKPQPRCSSFQTSKVTYGGVDGAYYTSTRTRRAGNDGVIVEESKEADKTTGQATHRISRGIHEKGHTVTRKLASDGNVDTTQTLHNLNEDELAGFEEAWKGNVKGQLPGSSEPFAKHDTSGPSEFEHKMGTLGGWALPYGKQSPNTGATSAEKTKKVVRINIE